MEMFEFGREDVYLRVVFYVFTVYFAAALLSLFAIVRGMATH
jgi:hypothetical protein